MSNQAIPFQTTEWETLSPTFHTGETGMAEWRTKEYGNLRIRLVDYSDNYKADHWCEKGHIVFCIEGELTTELSDGRTFQLKKGMSYTVSDTLSSHRSITQKKTRLFIIDGAFLGIAPDPIPVLPV
jgi:mannose-6-phosphate isomerase class I